MNNTLLLTLACAGLTMNAVWAQNVGISVTNPIEKLDVNGDVYVRGNDVYFSHDAATNGNNDYFSYDDVNNLPFLGLGMFHFHSDRARGEAWNQPTASISARGAYFQGRVAIGTETPQTLLHIANPGGARITLEADTDNVNENDNPRIEMFQDNRIVGAMIGFFDGAVNNGNTFRIGMRDASVTDWNTFTINAATKHVGIGTATPDQRLELQGGGIQLNGNFGIGFLGELPYEGNVTNDAAHFYWDGDFGGQYSDFLLLEKTDGNQVDPDGGIAFTNKGSDNIRELAMIIRGNNRVGIQVLAPTYALELPNNATAGIGQARANAWITYSDGRLKSERRALPYGLATIMQLQPLQYFQANSNQDEKGNIQIAKEGATQIGFIAQELEQVVPEAVTRPTEEGKDYWGVDYTRLVPVLTKAIQEQQESIQKLEEKCAHLEAELRALKN